MTRSNLLDRYPHGVLTEQEGGIPNDVLNYDQARHVCRLHRIREDVCPDAQPRSTVPPVSPNKPKTPLHSFRCPDELWDAAKAKADERGEVWGEELRKMVERYVKRK